MDPCLGIATGHDARRRALGPRHAVAQHHDDVLRLLATRPAGTTSKLPVAVTTWPSLCVAVTVKVCTPGLSALTARMVAMLALVGTLGRQPWAQPRRATFTPSSALPSMAKRAPVMVLPASSGAQGGLQVKALAGQEAGNHRRSVAAAEQLAGRCEPTVGPRGRLRPTGRQPGCRDVSCKSS